ncbi:GNAT family N-acetyltransferase [Levilactobacillus enshiensis]|uniref:GNAT family N-acetyltransferase n=1 Tax=Levilactobacillus enshiensis TaxID=2590213 RepID=UPI00117B34CA|nr:GNAT family N-acetyltransferase [Levilactobacillus enshiensis]
MTGKIKTCTLQDLKTLQQVSRTTFTDTFGAANTPADLAEYLDTAYSDAQLTQEMQQPTAQFAFILVAGQVAGYLKLNWGASQSEHRGEATLEIERIYILPEFKRQGLGRQFYDYAVATAKQLNCRTIWLGVWEHNQPAQKFYHRLGFHPVGDHVFQLGEDAQRDLILEKTLV